MDFEPIAIVGQSCTLPDAPSPAALWENLVAGRSALSAAPGGPEGRWGLSRELAMGRVEDALDRTWSDVGGYVRGFEAGFDPSGFRIDAETIAALDPLFHWVLAGVRQALGGDAPARTGLVLGNLSFPTSSMSRYAESVWLDAQGARYAGGDASARAGVTRPHAFNRFSSGLPAHLAARALGLDAGAFALDAACASSLYAIKLACDRLHDRSADVMVAGGVNRADDLFIHVGFCALAAMSRTGRSRPFHRDADGLVPAEGAGFVVLRRLADAVASGSRVLGVIRGIGLSNDGRGRGLLAPSEEGQERAIRMALHGAGLAPADIGMVECHATGTPVGDATEIRSMARVYQGCADVPIGSLKSNLGHLVTAAGVAGLIKLLGAMEHGLRPATLHAEEPVDALHGTPFRLLHAAEPWDGPRRAALSAFGFGGNNAHLIVESWDEFQDRGRHVSVPAPAAIAPEPIAIVGIGARVADGESVHDFADALFDGEARHEPRATVAVALEGLRSPPADLADALAQQTLVLEAAREATQEIALPRERTSVLVGMGCDPEIARYGARWRVAAWAAGWAESEGGAVDPEWLAAARDAFQSGLKAAGVVGTMPNIPANRISSQLDVAGPSFTVSAEEASGLVAIDVAVRALRAGHLDAAVVAAVDLSHEGVHLAALESLGHRRAPGDAAVVLVLKRLADARRDGNPVHAVLAEDEAPATLALGDASGGLDLERIFGAPHAATGLLHVAAGVLALRHRARPRLGAWATPWFGERRVEVAISALEAPPRAVRLAPGDCVAWLGIEPPPRLHVYSGRDREGALVALEARRESDAGPARLVLVAADGDELAARADAAQRWLRRGGPPPEGVAFRERPVDGELAFVFTGAAAAYPGMARDLALGLPGLVDAVAARCEEMRRSTDWLYGPGDGTPAHPLDQLWGTSFVCQLHAELSRGLLGLSPRATLGYSSGESNALFALGAWTDLDAMIRESRAGKIFTRELAGAFDAPRRAWARLGLGGETWGNYIVSAPVEHVRSALAGEPLAHLTIINTPEDCVIGGEASACERVLARLGRGRALPLGYDIAAHCPELQEIHAEWRALHHRATRDVPGVRFYTHATGSWFHPTADAAADAITEQAARTLDFPRLVEQAWADGVRVFVEHGPRGLCSGWIKRILGERDHIAVPLDVQGRSGLRQAMNAAAWLLAAGVDVHARALEEALSASLPPPRAPGRRLTLAAHAPAPRLPAFEPRVQVMARAPRLHPVLADPMWAAPVVDAPPAPVTKTVPLAPAPAHSEEMVRYFQQLGAVHRDFVQRSADVHQRFLALQRSTEATLFRAYGAVQRGTASGATASQPATAALAVRGATPGDVAVIEPAPTTPAYPITAPEPRPSTRALPGPTFDRAQLEVLASGRISSVFGPAFAGQDGYHRQVRMPEPPLLLADRVAGIDATPGRLGTGTLWTETDVREDSWYLSDEGRMPAGIMIEAGQADLLLISWMGVDALNRGERVYRLLGCELTYHGSLCRPGDTLVYDIHVDGHANQGEVRLFFFHYDCRVRGESRLTVRGGQAGFFTDEELAGSAGVLWDPVEEPYRGDGPLDPPAVVCEARSFGRDRLRAFAEGRPWDCFGRGFEATRAHVRPPKISAGRMLFLDEITDFDPRGGPWGRGYLRAETPVTPDDWYFAGHFKNDPCMPGTLMFEGCLQAMAVYLAAMGYTVDRDGWRFEPVPDEQYLMRCRGQITPASRHAVYELFVSEVRSGPTPTVFADLLCTVDGLKAFHARRVGLRLVPDWPLEHWRQLGPHVTQPTGVPAPLRALGGLVGHVEPKPVASVDGFSFGLASLLACAWGRPSSAFGPFYGAFDGTRRVARLPGPPYHFMSRVTRIDAEMGAMRQGGSVEVEYDVPEAAWYFDQNGAATMPFCVLMEAALQPCGWLASFVGSALTAERDLLFRNLDGTGTLFEEIVPGSGPLRTRARITSISKTAGMIIEAFHVECFLGERRVYEMSTVFGFFPKEAFEDQAGLPASDEERARITAPSQAAIDLAPRPARFFEGAARLPGEMLRMLDRVTGWWPEGGSKGLGYLRAEKDVDPGEWFFKAHFFQDPVQPGSLGVEALCQLLQLCMLERGMADGLARPRFEPLILGRAASWKYRGQVVPANRTLTTELELTEVGEDERGRYAVADAWLWVDGKRIYAVRNLGMRLVAGAAPDDSGDSDDEVLDPAVDAWLGDHRPTFTMPALPMMSMVDRLARAVARRTGRAVVALRDVQVLRWLPFPGGPVRLRTEVSGSGDVHAATLLAWREAGDPRLSRFEPVASASVLLASDTPAPSAVAPLDEHATEPVDDPYASGALFHGPAFQYLRELRRGPRGASAVLDAGHGSVPRSLLHQGLLDATTHAIPHDELWRWSSEIPRDVVAYPYRIPEIRLLAPLPDRRALRLEARFAGFDGDPRFPAIDLQILDGDRLLVALRLIEVLLPKGPIGTAPSASRRAFLRDRTHVPGIGLSRVDGEATVLEEAVLRGSDWLPGNVARIYGVPSSRGAALLTEVAVRDHVARKAFVHPSALHVGEDRERLFGVRAAVRPLRLHRVRAERDGEVVRVVDAGPPVQDLEPLRSYWRERIGVGPWPIEDLYFGLIARSVGDVVIVDPDAFAAVRGRSCLYLGNHQVGIESLLFSVVLSALSGTPTLTLAKAEHRTSWLGTLIAHSFAYPGVTDPRLITFFDREDRESLLGVVGEIGAEMRAGAKSAMVHVEGTRSLACGRPVEKMSSAFIDLALAVGAPIIPVRFVGGLPVEELAARREFPVGFGRQDYWIGTPILPERLAAMAYKDRKATVLAAMNALGPEIAEERPSAPDPAFEQLVDAWIARTGATLEDAAMFCTLAMLVEPGEPVRRLCEAARGDRWAAGADPRDAWLAVLARRFFGPRGPAVEHCP